MADQSVKRPEPTRAGRIALVFAGVAFGFSLGVRVGGDLGPDARLGGVLVYQIAMLIGFPLLFFGIATRRRRLRD
jgi:hypothetical protein